MHTLGNVLIYTATRKRMQPHASHFIPPRYYTHIQVHPVTRLCLHTLLGGHPGAELRLTVDVPGSLWCTPMYDQESSAICLVWPRLPVHVRVLVRTCVSECIVHQLATITLTVSLAS